jgi:pimeloyl-ACP methyl ester carboxylesterase
LAEHTHRAAGGDAPTTDLRRYGAAPFRVAVVHGGPGAPGSVAAVARELARERGVLEPLQAARSVDGQVAELGAVLARAASTPVVLIGHSWGAWLAALLAARRPALVGKLILVGSGAFEERYVAGLRERRLARLASDERAEYERLVRLLEQPAGPAAADRDTLLARLGRLTAQTDNHDAIEDAGAAADALPVDGDAYRAVWPEAAALRRSGALLAEIGRLVCPVVAIHGADDPSPAAGVDEPLRAALGAFRFVMLERCGHTPWKERHAREAFYACLREEIANDS